MSGSGDSFGEDVASLENVQRLESADYLCEYIGVLADTEEQVHIITLAPELADVDAAVDAFTEVSDQWFNASANANIRQIRERGTDPQPWIAMPDDNAKTLATVQPDLSPDAIETVIAETADALRTLGLYNTVHGHLSPDDIYLPNRTVESEGSTVELGGFGLEAAIRTAVNEYEPTAYTAPELVDDSTQPSEKTDVYGLGAVTYFALTGRAPIAGADLGEAIRDGLTNQPSTYVDGIAADVDEVVTQALSPDPGDRYESPYAFHRAFLSVFDPNVLRPDDTDGDSDEEADTTDSADPVDGSSAEDELADPIESGDTNEKGVTRRAAASFLGVVALGGVGVGWYFSRWLLAAPDPAEETPTTTATPTERPTVTQTPTERPTTTETPTERPAATEPDADEPIPEDRSTDEIQRTNADGEVYQIGRVIDRPGSLRAGTEVSVTIRITGQIPDARDNIVYGAVGSPSGTIYGLEQMSSSGTGSVTVEASIPAEASGTILWTWVPAVTNTQAQTRAEDSLESYNEQDPVALPLGQVD